jgi:hypothetical protein
MGRFDLSVIDVDGRSRRGPFDILKASATLLHEPGLLEQLGQWTGYPKETARKSAWQFLN